MVKTKNTPKAQTKLAVGRRMRLCPPPRIEATTTETDAQIVMKAAVVGLGSLIQFATHFSPQTAALIRDHVSKMDRILRDERDRMAKSNLLPVKLHLIVDNMRVQV